MIIKYTHANILRVRTVGDFQWSPGNFFTCDVEDPEAIQELLTLQNFDLSQADPLRMAGVDSDLAFHIAGEGIVDAAQYSKATKTALKRIARESGVTLARLERIQAKVTEGEEAGALAS